VPGAGAERRGVEGGLEGGDRGGAADEGRAVGDGRVGIEGEGQQAENGVAAQLALKRGQRAPLSIETVEPVGNGGGQEEADEDASRPTMFRCVSMSQLSKVLHTVILCVEFLFCVSRCIDALVLVLAKGYLVPETCHQSVSTYVWANTGTVPILEHRWSDLDG